MKVEYGKSRTYKYELDKETLEWLTDQTNRARHQTQFLFNLVDGDLGKLMKLEEQLKNCFVGYCPGDKESVDEVLNMKPSREWFKFDDDLGELLSQF